MDEKGGIAMAYNSFFPAGYQPAILYPQPTQSASANVSPQTQHNIIWVQGEASAKSYLVAPNQTVQLWDSESQTIYIKSADGAGRPSMATRRIPTELNGIAYITEAKRDISAQSM